jgi:hypothetical protein
MPAIVESPTSRAFTGGSSTGSLRIAAASVTAGTGEPVNRPKTSITVWLVAELVRPIPSVDVGTIARLAAVVIRRSVLTDDVASRATAVPAGTAERKPAKRLAVMVTLSTAAAPSPASTRIVPLA